MASGGGEDLVFPPNQRLDSSEYWGHMGEAYSSPSPKKILERPVPSTSVPTPMLRNAEMDHGYSQYATAKFKNILHLRDAQ